VAMIAAWVIRPSDASNNMDGGGGGGVSEIAPG
jgi:hypothetical protein